ncbi:PIN domain containing protein (Yacp-like protein) [Zostera marina]|uniref:PIN domain containing protein (Yacp-like protein) n=1 Tax=Zostera marina TaxID=29655 RepID=A0A0K9PHL1_ZOSMR|nr:PIN domain containing protein (Yacp-like protein) [Zostera marina]
MQGYLCHSKAVQLNSIKIAVGGSNLVGIFPLREAGEVMRAAASPAFMVIRSKKSEPQKGSDHVPRRITSNVKQNLQFIKLWKAYQKQKQSTPRPATSYRKKKIVKEELPEDEEMYRDPTLNLYYTNQDLDTAVPVLLVDGYNVCGYWAKLKKHFINGNLATARQKLIDELITFSVLKEVKVVVVFDAMLSGLPNHKESFAGIDVVFSAETCADAWIEKEVAALREDGCPRVWVVTSDCFQQQAAHGAGAFIWSCKALVTEIKSSQRELEQIVHDQRSSSVQGKLLQHNLNADVVLALKDLKRKLSQ